MRVCYICKTPTSQYCVGCGDTARVVCDKCALACAWCEDPGPYCKQCFNCQSGGKDCGAPGNHKCGNCERVIKKGEQRLACVECDEWLYHAKCVLPCSCGEDHYLCKSDSHSCEGTDLHKEGYGCSVNVCEKNGLVECLYDREVTLRLCKGHQEYMNEEIKRRYKKLKSEK